MAEIKALGSISEKWKSNAGASEARNSYASGVASPRRSWAASAAAADQARKDGLAEADARNAFVSGVQGAGDAKWKARATALGPARFAQGVQVAQTDYQQGFAPYHSAIQGAVLPPRESKGSPANLERVAAVANLLHNTKVNM